ncbi:DNA polymerase III subunit alpha [Burkholderiales bacterium]|nr:DNA polymerase III subunit alpha [Burkholderiales bacterium]
MQSRWYISAIYRFWAMFNRIAFMATEFVHLRLHSEFSVVDGVTRIDDVVRRAAADGQGAIALTDSANLFGAIRFYVAARRAGVKPILGCDAWISNDADREQPHRLTLLAQNRDGYFNLCRLLSRAWLENQHHDRAEIRADWFEPDCTEGLIALSAGPAGEVGLLLSNAQPAAARAAAQRLAGQFPGRFYIEIQRAGRPGDEACCRASVALAARLSLPLVATHPIQFLEPEDFRAHEARVCIAEGRTLSDPRRPRRFTAEQYFLSTAQMIERFADVPSALRNAVEIARRCNLQLELGKPRLPDYPTPTGISLDQHCRDLASVGLGKRLCVLFAEPALRTAKQRQYEARLESELATIAKMGFSGYFLIVADFINWAKTNGVPVGPGRGSGAGSLVAYALAITDLDPIRYDLLFERFLNPERVSMPDFDIDFCQDGRDRVIDYVKKKYGAQAVSQIATFGTLGAKAVVRDAGRVLDLPYTKCDQLSKLIPHNPTDPWTLERALKEEPAFAAAVNGDEEAAALVALARPLEGLVRNVGMHAGGVLIAPGRLTDFCPLYCAQGTDAVVSQFDKDDVEAIGLVKFDFLGLTTLTILDLTLRYLRALDSSNALTLESIPLDDAGSFALFRQANTTAVFQFESRGMRDLLKRARPDRFDDLIALVSLFRPGPMELIPEFCDRKHGKRAHYLDARLEPILGSTYGIMVYQEQVMQIAQTIGGYSLGAADLLRRAMGKKKPEEMAKHRSIFVAGAAKNGVPERAASELFDQMEKFAGYGFNKSHAAAYALIAYQTAYLKVHYAAAFAAANLSVVMDVTEKVQDLVADARSNGLTICAPDINVGVYRFVPVDATTVQYGLGAIKGTGAAAIDSIVEARHAGPFLGLADFCARVDKHRVNRRVIEALIRAGAFDRLDPDRARLIAGLAPTLDDAERAQAHAGQESLFGGAGTVLPAPAEVAFAPWSERERLANERVALGFCFSGHLFTEFESEARRIAPTRLADLKQARESVRVAGIVVSVRQQNTRRGRMCAVLIDDASAQLEVAVFAELFDRRRAFLKEDQLIFVTGRARFDEFSQRLALSADDVMDLAEARALSQAALTIRVEDGIDPVPLGEVLAAYRASGTNLPGGGGCRVVMSYANHQAAAEIMLPDLWRVRGDERLIEDLRTQAKVSAIFQYA